MTHRLIRIVSTLVIITMFLSACGNTPAPEAAPLRVGWILWGGFYPLIIGHEKRIFEKHGIKVEPILYEQYSNGLADFQSGKLDAMTMSLGDAVLLEGRAPGTVIFPLLTDISMEAEGIVAISELATPQDLKGKKIGCNLGTYGELFIRYMLAANNIDPASVEIVNVSPENLPDALANGEVQAGHVWEPILSETTQRGNRILYLASAFPGLITDGVAVRAYIARERPEDVRAFDDAWFETLTWWQENPDEAAQIIIKYSGLTAADISTEGINLFGLEQNLAAFNPGEDTTSVYFTAGLYRDFLVETGLVTTPPDVEKILDPSFLK